MGVLPQIRRGQELAVWGIAIMVHILRSGLALVEEDEVTGEIAEAFAEVKRILQIPFVPNWMRVLANSPAAFKIYWAFLQASLKHSSLPESLQSIILYAIAERRNCEYCSAWNELSCRTLGIDEETLAAVVEDLGHVSPERLQAILKFAIKASLHPKELSAADYQRLREEGVSEEEIVEIVFLAAVASMNDTLADALKIDVDLPVAERLAQSR
ncbi:putative peroxidase-related enzyme [Calidithermus roseus]|uniref:Putative peroxidase-related enzyme n=2 Tax=Calidithermus roseus TaxID=1644118 RepID=A0A399ETX2_9DEIN|nr:putative peroxidase-related enzyme [Calidithermus roseus]